MDRREARSVGHRLFGGGVVIGLVLAVATAGGYAWSWWGWQGHATGPGSVSSGALDLTAGPSTGQEQLVGPGGSWAYPGLVLTDAVPTASVAGSFVLRAAPTTDLTVAIRIASASDALGPYLQASLWTGGTAINTTTGGLARGSCDGLQQSSAVVVSTTPATVLPDTDLATGQTLTVCLVVTLAGDAPVTLQSATSGALTLTVTAVQQGA